MLATLVPDPAIPHKYVTYVDYDYTVPAHVTINGVIQTGYYWFCHVPAKVNGRVNLPSLRTCVLFGPPNISGGIQ